MISLPSGQSYCLKPRSTTILVVLFRPNLTTADMCSVSKRVAGRTKIRGRCQFSVGSPYWPNG